MKIALLAAGSRGDIQPLLAVADALVRRGHRVRMTVNTNLVDWASQSAVEVVPMEPDSELVFKSEEGRALLASGKLARFFRIMGQLERDHSAQMIAACREAATGADLVVSTVLTVYRGLCLAEKLDVPHGLVSTVPYLGTRRWASFVSPLPDLRFGWLNRLSYPLMHALMWHQARPLITHLREVLGLPPVVRRPRVEALRSVHLYSGALIQRPEEWAPQHELAGFCFLRPELRTSLGEGEIDPELETWLEAGPAPVYFGFGSMPVLHPERIFGWVTALARKRGFRALIGAGWSDYGIDRGRHSDHLYVASMFNHDRGLPRCRAAFHHGGAGTTAAALRAGLPSAVLSFFADQPFWGWRIKHLGAGTTLRFRDLTEASLESCLDTLLKDDTGARAQRLGRELTQEDGATRAAEIVERWARA